MAGEYDPAAQTYTLDVTQTCAPSPGQSTKEPFHIPLAIGLLDGHGNSLPLKRLGSNQTRRKRKPQRFSITQSQSQFTFVEVPEAPVPSVLRDFSAPVKATIPRGAGELGFLSAHDPDPFNRWDAGQDYALQLMLTTIRAHQMGSRLERRPGFCGCHPTHVARQRARARTDWRSADITGRDLCRGVSRAYRCRGCSLRARSIAEASGDPARGRVQACFHELL